MTLEIKGLLAGLAAAIFVLGATFGVSAVAMRLAPGPARSEHPAPAGGPKGHVVASSQLVTTGGGLYTQSCASCHGTNGEGGVGPSLYNSDLSDAEIARTINNGIKGRMPAFGDQYKVPQTQALTAYIRSLKK